MLNLSKTSAVVLFLIPFQKWFANISYLFVPDAKDFVYVCFEFAWIIIFIGFGLFSSFSKKLFYIYGFVIISFLVFVLNLMMWYDGNLNIVLAYLSGFRRLAVPFITFFIFYKLSLNKSGLVYVEQYVIKLYWVVLYFQFADFLLMQLFEFYRDAVVALSNVGEGISDQALYSHIVILGWQPLRSFGILLNFHGSGLLLVLLYLYKTYLKGASSLTERCMFIVGVLAGGSLQNLGCLIALIPLLYGNQYIIRRIAVVTFFPLIIGAVSYFSNNPLWFLGDIYMFEYIIIVMNIIYDMLSQQEMLTKFILGFGNLSLIVGGWTIGQNDLELGDIGFVRVILESGLFVFILWLFLLINVGRYSYKFNNLNSHNNRLRVNSLFAIPVISIISLVHYPVIFMAANSGILMLALVKIYTFADGTFKNTVADNHVVELSR